MNIQNWKNKAKEAGFQEEMKKLYGAKAEENGKRYEALLDMYGEAFGDSEEISLFSAPGRTEIGGNHTDHNNGVVIAAAVNLDIIAVVAKNDENVVRVISHGFGKIDDVNLRDLTRNPLKQSTAPA